MLGLQTSVDVATTATDTAPVAVQEKTLSIMELILDGGMGSIIIIGILFVMLAVALFLYFERLFAIKAASKVPAFSIALLISSRGLPIRETPFSIRRATGVFDCTQSILAASKRPAEIQSRILYIKVLSTLEAALIANRRSK